MSFLSDPPDPLHTLLGKKRVWKSKLGLGEQLRKICAPSCPTDRIQGSDELSLDLEPGVRLPHNHSHLGPGPRALPLGAGLARRDAGELGSHLVVSLTRW